MIPTDFITQWRRVVSWPANEQVEHDLVISRAIVAMYNEKEIAARLAWRGGTALHKPHLQPAPRYSEDIDLVQVDGEPIGATLDILRRALDPWLGKPRRVFKEGRVNLVYRYESEGPPAVPLRLKIEINTREHFSDYGHAHQLFAVESRWFTGRAEVTTFTLDELLGTKLRALYQRRKGRDLFDLWTALEQGQVDPDRVITCFRHYRREGRHSATRAQFEENLAGKRKDPRFTSDITPLLRPGVDWDLDRAMEGILSELVARLPGEPWQGES